MIDTATETRCKNPNCGKPIVHIPGHRKREYCNDTCKQTAYRQRSRGITGGAVTIVDDRQRSGENHTLDRVMLERRFLNIGQQAKYPQIKIVTVSETRDLARGRSSWHDFLVQADDALLVEAIHHAETFLDIMITVDSDQHQRRITELEQALAEANDLIEKLTSKKSTTPLKKSYQERLTRKGEALDWPALEVHTTIKPGRKNWRVFMLNESNDQLIRAIIAAERIEEKHSQS